MFSNPIHRKFRKVIDEFFQNPFVQKISNQETTSIYVCKIASLLLNEKRYLIAITSLDNTPIGHVTRLLDLEWMYFQSRILEGDEYVSAISHSYIVKNELTWPFTKTKTTKDYSIFVEASGTYPVEITLLHTSGDEYEYPNSGTLASCLETYQTIIRFIDE